MPFCAARQDLQQALSSLLRGAFVRYDPPSRPSRRWIQAQYHSGLSVDDNALKSAGGYGVGWTLTAYHQGRWCWSTSLASRGAADSASARVAQAVAVRVLAEQGVAVHGWVADSAEDESPKFRAR